MSRVADQPALNGSPSNGRAVDPTPSPQASFDIVQILWRWKWLPILGAFIGTGLGYLFFSKQPAEYQASALVQVANSLPSTTRTDTYDANEVVGTGTRADESMVIRSQKVLRMAVTNGRLTEKPALANLHPDEIVAMLSETRDLVVEPAAKDANTTLISISYICNDADLAADVVNAIVDGYSDYLSEEYRSVGNEIYELVTEAQTKLQNTYRELNLQALEFQKQTPDIMWTPDGATDPYAENYLGINRDLSSMRVRRQKLSATLKHVEEAVKAGRPAESILLMLTTDEGSTLADYYYNRPGQQAIPGKTDFDMRIDTESSRMERDQLFALQMREKELLDTVGAQHPSVASIRKRVTLMQEHIARLRESERRLSNEEERLQQEAFDSQISPEGISTEKRLEIRRQALAEEYALIALQETALQVQADIDQKKSNELQLVLGNSRLLNSEINSIQTLLDAYTDKIHAIELLPKSGQRTLKELNLPSIGGFYGPKLAPYLLGGAAIGFLLLSGLAVLMDLADRSYRNPEEIAQDLGVQILGHIPVMDITKVRKSIKEVDASVTTIHHSKGRVSEAYRTVRTGLYFSNHGRDLKVIQVTSPVPGDGKSTLSSNVAVTMAQSGRNVLLIDADFRRPRIAKIFGVDSDVGMATVLAGKAELDEAIHQGPVANLSIMPGGKRPNNPAELLSSQRFADLIQLLREKFDVIIIDTPPLLAVSDPGAVAGVVDGVVLTMRLRRNVKPLATRAISILDGVGATCLGVVVNGVSSEAGYGYNYDYNDYRYAYKYGSNYRSGYGYRYGYGNYRYGYTAGHDEDLAPKVTAEDTHE